MCIKHEIVINDYNRFVFADAIEALECYKLLSKSMESVRVYAENPDGTTDYGSWTDQENIPNITMKVYRADKR